MLKNLIINIVIAGSLVLSGGLWHDYSSYDSVNKKVGIIVLSIGIAYGILSIIIFIYKYGTPLVKKAVSDKEKNNAQEDLLKYKKLFDEGILTQDEFSKKSKELKNKIL